MLSTAASTVSFSRSSLMASRGASSIGLISIAPTHRSRQCSPSSVSLATNAALKTASSSALSIRGE